MTEPRSKLLARFDPSATAANKRPAITGSFTLVSDGITRAFRAWSGVSEGGKTYLRGTHEPEKLTSAVKARHAAVADAEGPPNITLNAGELILFENAGVAENEKRPSWYGFARIPEGYVRLSAWDRSGARGAKLLAGTAEPYRPAQPAERPPELDTPSQT
jgi:hypothetical protein